MISTKTSQSDSVDPAEPSFRSGETARIAGMPVATLRIWEQRYNAVRPSTRASGHRLYSAADVERVTLLRRLTQQGQPIGLLAPLSTDQIRDLLLGRDGAASTDRVDAHAIPMRIVVVGQPLAARLRRFARRSPQRRLLQLVAVFDSLKEALKVERVSSEGRVDLLLWQAGTLQPGAVNELLSAQDAWAAHQAAVVYRFSSAGVRSEMVAAGAEVLQEPADDEELGRWLANVARNVVERATERHGAASVFDREPAAPRFSELGLTEFASLSSSMACECPGHVAQLLLQISSFETYSSECLNRNEADAQLHAYLRGVAGAARTLFEAALERVALAEGLPLPGGSSMTAPA